MPKTKKQTEEYPECERLAAAHDTRQAVHEFLEWLGTQKVHLMVYKNERDTRYEEKCDGSFTEGCKDGKRINTLGRLTDKDCSRCRGKGMVQRSEPGWYPIDKTRENVVMEFLGIDPAKLEAERKAMIEALRS
jgi:hypothetical protein